MARFWRRTLGPKFSEAARQLWLEVLRRGWSATQARKALDLPQGQISKLLYGERRAGRMIAEKIKLVLGIDPHLWDLAPEEEFTLPALQEEREERAVL